MIPSNGMTGENRYLAYASRYSWRFVLSSMKALGGAAGRSTTLSMVHDTAQCCLDKMHRDRFGSREKGGWDGHEAYVPALREAGGQVEKTCRSVNGNPCTEVRFTSRSSALVVRIFRESVIGSPVHYCISGGRCFWPMTYRMSPEELAALVTDFMEILDRLEEIGKSNLDRAWSAYMAWRIRCVAEEASGNGE